jgi:tetratricopeptide (TPR) repeat protein
MQASRCFPQHPLVLAQLSATLKSTGQHYPEAFSAAQEAGRCLAAGERDGKSWVIPTLGDQPAALTHALIAATACAAGDYDAALNSIGQALTIFPEEPGWHALAAKIHSQRRDYDESVEHLEQACRLEPNNYQHFLGLGSALLAVPVDDQELSERAINAFEKAADLAPDSTEAWMLLAEAYSNAGLLSKASGCCERAMTLAPDQPAPLILRAEIALQASDPQEAYNRLQSAMSLPVDSKTQPDAQQILLLARVLDQLNRPGEALTELEKALEQVSEPLPLLLERVHLIRRSQGMPAAVEALRTLGEQYPQEPVVLAYMAKGYAETGNKDAAISYAQRALQTSITPDVLLVLDTDEQARMHLLLGKLLRQSGQLDQSLYHLNEANLKDPRLLEPYLELGCVLQERRQINQALQIYNRATTIAPRDPRPYFQAGLALKDSKDYIGAEAMLRRAASLAPNDLGIHRQLGAVVALNLVHNRRRSAVDV